MKVGNREPGETCGVALLVAWRPIKAGVAWGWGQIKVTGIKSTSLVSTAALPTALPVSKHHYHIRGPRFRPLATKRFFVSANTLTQALVV
jgi:hypothetical protein